MPKLERYFEKRPKNMYVLKNRSSKFSGTLYKGAGIFVQVYTLLKIFKGLDFQSHTFGNVLGKILPDCSPV